MNGCVNKALGQLLHDYELGLLSDEDNDRFEMHLYECDYCLAQVREFMDVSRILTEDPDARAVLEEIAREPGIKKDKKKFSPFLKLLIAAVLIVVIAVPVYKYGIQEGPSGITQTLDLLPARTGGSDVIYLEKGSDAVINFYVADSIKGPVSLVISKVDGDTVLMLQDFTDFNGRGMGTVTVPVTDFSEGHYILHIRPISELDLKHEKLYMFRVK